VHVLLPDFVDVLVLQFRVICSCDGINDFLICDGDNNFFVSYGNLKVFLKVFLEVSLEVSLEVLLEVLLLFWLNWIVPKITLLRFLFLLLLLLLA